MDSSSRQVVVVVDFQADFTEQRNGALAVPETGIDYVEAVIAQTRKYKEQGLAIVATRDHHSHDHVSFHTSHEDKKPLDVVEVSGRKQVLWPPHCVQGTEGATILLPDELITAVSSKGEHPEFECYSGLRDCEGRETGLKAVLEELGASELIVYGLATDYCVRATVLDALKEGFAVRLVADLSKGITPESTQAALDEMRAAGAEIV